jgi:hypothetical protein
MPKNSEGLERKYLWLDALHHHTGGRVEVVHGTFRARKHRFYIERDELDNLVRSGIPVDWEHLAPGIPTFRPHLRIHEEKQTDVMLACSLVTDAALWRVGETAKQTIQAVPNHRLNPRPTPSACHAAVVVSADIDFLPAAETAASLFNCPVAMAFAFPHTGYKVSDFAMAKSKRVFTTEITEDDLRRNMLPSETVLPDGRRIEFRKVKSSHFAGTRFGPNSTGGEKRRNPRASRTAEGQSS